MLSRVVSTRLATALSKYFYVTEEQLNLSVITGKGTIDDLRLKPESLEEFDFPFRVVAGMCRRVSFSIPWASLKSKPCECTVDEIVLLATNLMSDPTSEEVAAKIKRAKDRMIAAFEEERKALLNDDENKGFASRMFEVILHNLMIHVKQVHIRFESSYHDAAAGLLVNNIDLQTTNEDGASSFVDPSQIWRLHKKLSFTGLRLYCEEPEQRTHIADCHSSASDTGVWLHRMRTARESAVECNVLGPIDGSNQFAMVFKKFIVEKSDLAPFMMVIANLGDIVASLSRDQYVSLLRIISLCASASGRAPKAEDQPSRPDLFASYETLFEKSLFKEMKDGTHESDEWHTVQELMSGPDVVECRKRVYQKLKDSIAHRRMEDEKRAAAAPAKSSGWFGGWLGGSKTDENTKLYAALEKEYGIEEDEEVPDLRSLPRDYCWTDYTINVGVVGCCVRSPSETWVHPCEARLEQLTIGLKKLNSPGSLLFDVGVSSFSMTNPTVSASWISHVIHSRFAQSSSQQLVSVHGSVNPVTPRIPNCDIDASLSVHIAPLFVIGDPRFLDHLGDFFAVPEHIQLEKLSKATAQLASSVTDAAGAQLAGALAGSKTLDIVLDATAPTFILPAALSRTKPESPVMVVSLGRFQYASQPLTRDERSARVAIANQAADDHDSLLLHYPHKAELSDVSLALCGAGPAVRGELPSHYLISRIHVNADLYTRIVANADHLPPVIVKASAKSVELSLSLHDCFVLRHFIDSWASPATPVRNTAAVAIAPVPTTQLPSTVAAASLPKLRSEFLVDSFRLNVLDDSGADLSVASVTPHREPRFEINSRFRFNFNTNTDSTLVLIDLNDVELCDHRHKSHIIEKTTITVRVSIPAGSAKLIDVVVAEPLFGRVGTPLMDFVDRAIDVKNMLLAPAEGDAIPTSTNANMSIATNDRGDALMLTNTSRRRDELTTRITVSVSKATIALFDRPASSPTRDVELADACVSAITVDVRMFEQSLSTDVTVGSATLTLCDPALPFRQVLKPQAEVNSNEPMVKVSFDSRAAIVEPVVTVVDPTDGSVRVANLKSVEFAKKFFLSLSPSVVLYDTTLLLTLIDYATSGFLSRFAMVASRRRYDGKSIPPPPPAPRHLTEIEIQVSRPSAIVPYDLRVTDSPALTTSMEHITVKNRIGRRDERGSLTTTIELHGMRINDFDKTSKNIALISPKMMTLNFEGPMTEGPSQNIISCEDLGRIDLTEEGLIGFIRTLSTNILRLPPPKAVAAPETEKNRQVARVYPSDTTVKIGGFQIRRWEDGDTIFTAALKDFVLHLESPETAVSWDTLAIYNKADVCVMSCNSGSVTTRSVGSHKDIALTFDLKRFALTNDWVRFYDATLNDLTYAAMAPLFGPAPAKDAPQAPPGTMTLDFMSPGFTMPFMMPDTVADEVFCAEIAKLHVRFERHADGAMTVVTSIGAIRLDDTKRKLPMLSEAGSTTATMLRVTYKAKNGDQLIAVDLDQLLSSIYTPSVYDLIAFVSNKQGSIGALAQLSSTREARLKQQQDVASSPVGAPSAAPKGTLHVDVRWQRPTICFAIDSSNVESLHDYASQLQATALLDGSRTASSLAGRVSSGVAVDLGAMTASVHIDYATQHTKVGARLTGAAISGLLSDTQIDLTYNANDESNSTEVHVTNTTLEASPSAMTTLNQVLSGNLALANPHTPSRTSEEAEPESPMRRPVSSTVSFSANAIGICCRSDQNVQYAVYQIVATRFQKDSTGATALTIEELVGHAPDRGTPDAFLRCGGGSENALEWRQDAERGGVATIADLKCTVLPEVLGRTIDLALVFVSPESTTTTETALAAPPEAAPPTRLTVSLRRAQFHFVALDNSPVATLYLDGMSYTRDIDERGKAKSKIRLERVSLDDDMTPNTKFKTLLDSATLTSNLRLSRPNSPVSSNPPGSPTGRFSTGVPSFIEVTLQSDISPPPENPDEPHFVQSAIVSVSGVTLYYVPAVLVEIQASVSRAAAVMANAENAQKRAASAGTNLATARTNLTLVDLQMARPTLVLVRDVTSEATVAVSPGSLFVTNKVTVLDSNRFGEEFTIRIVDMAMTALNVAVVEQVGACDIKYVRDKTTKHRFRELQQAAAAKGDPLLTDTTIDVTLPQIKAVVSQQQYQFLLEFAWLLSSARAKELLPVKDDDVVGAADVNSKKTTLQRSSTVESVSSGATAVGAPDLSATELRCVWNGAQVFLCDVFSVEFSQLNVERRTFGGQSTTNIATQGATMKHLDREFARIEELKSSIVNETAVPSEREEGIHVSRVEATCGMFDVSLSPKTVSAAFDRLEAPFSQHFLRKPPPGPCFVLQQSATATVQEDLKPTADNYIAIHNESGIATFVLDLNGHVLDLTSANGAAPLIVTQDHTRTRICNGTVRLPGFYSLQSFVHYGFNSSLDLDTHSITVIRKKFPTAKQVREEEREQAVGRPRLAQQFSVKFKLRFTVCGNERPEPVGAQFDGSLTVSQRVSSGGVVEQRAISLNVSDLTDATSDLLKPTRFQLNAVGSNEVSADIVCDNLIAVLRYARARYVVTVLRQIMAALPKTPSSMHRTVIGLEDRKRRPLTRRSTLRECSLCRSPDAALGSGKITETVAQINSQTDVEQLQRLLTYLVTRTPSNSPAVGGSNASFSSDSFATGGDAQLNLLRTLAVQLNVKKCDMDSKQDIVREVNRCIAQLAQNVRDSDEADVYICVPCATGRRSLERTSLDLAIKEAAVTLVGRQGEMLHVAMKSIKLHIAQDLATFGSELNAWSSNSYCGQWEPIVEHAKVDVSNVISQNKTTVNVPAVFLNFTDGTLKSMIQFAQDAAAVAEAKNDKWRRETKSRVTNWSEGTVIFGNTHIRPQECKDIVTPTPYVDLVMGRDSNTTTSQPGSSDSLARLELSPSIFDKDAIAADNTVTYLALDRSASVAAHQCMVDVKVTAVGACSVDIVPVHSADGVVKFVSYVPQMLFLLGLGCVEPHGSLYLNHQSSIENSVVLQPLNIPNDDFGMTPPSTERTTLRRLLNGDALYFRSCSTTRPGVALYFRMNAVNLGMSLGVPRFEIEIRGGFRVVNRLPQPLKVQWVHPGTNTELGVSDLAINASDEVTVAASSDGSVKMRFTVTENKVTYQSNLIQFSSGERRLVLKATGGVQKELAAMVAVTEQSVSIYVPFIAVNHSVIPFEIEPVDDDRIAQRNYATLPSSDSVGVCICPPVRDVNESTPELFASFSFNLFTSATVPLHVIGTVGHLLLTDAKSGNNNNTLHFTYLTTFADDTYTTRTIVITPRWVTVNRTLRPLYFCQDLGTTSVNNVQLRPGTALHYYSMSDEAGAYMVNVGARARDGTGKSFAADAMGSGRVVIHHKPEDGSPAKLELVHVTVKPHGQLTYIIADPVEVAPHFFVNRTGETVSIVDGDTSDTPQTIAPWTAAAFVFNERRHAQSSIVMAKVAGVTLPINLKEEKQHDNPMELTYRLLTGPKGQVIVELLPSSSRQVVRYENQVHQDRDVAVLIQRASLSLSHDAKEILNAGITKIKLEQSRRRGVETLKASFLGFQVDNNTEDRPPHPVVLFSLRDEDRPAFAMSIQRRITGAAGYIHILSATIDPQPLVAQVSDLFAARLLRFHRDVTAGLSTLHVDEGEEAQHGHAALRWRCQDEQALYQNAPHEQGSLATTLMIDTMVINPVFLRFWFTRQREHDVIAAERSNMISYLAMSLEDVTVSADGYVSSKMSGSVSLVVAQLYAFYEFQIRRQLLGLLLQYASAIPLIGAPIKYATSLGDGFAKFFREPIDGLTESPEAFATGLARGTTALVGGVLGGGLAAVADVTKSGSRLANVVGGDRSNSGHSGKTPSTLRGFIRGFTGLVSKPIKGASEDGVVGFAKGAVHGVVGLVAAPVSGVLSDVSRVSNYAANVLKSTQLPDIDRVRKPRLFSHTGALVPLNAVVEILEHNRLNSDVWSSELLPTDGPRTRSGDRSMTKNDVERQYNIDLGTGLWKLDRYRTNFDGWLYSDSYYGVYKSTLDKNTRLRRRRWVLQVAPCEPNGTELLSASRFNSPQVVLLQGWGTRSSADLSITGSMIAATPAALASVTVKVVEVWENERFFPILGWGRQMLPTDRNKWSGIGGNRMPAPNDVALEPGWTWVNDWEVVHGPHSDDEGWLYAVDFPASYSSDSAMKSVRRRCWRRVAQNSSNRR